MADIIRPQTPPQSYKQRVRTPDAPLHGARTDAGPLSPRRSTRRTQNIYSTSSKLTNNRNGARTPPPQSSPPSPPLSPLYSRNRYSPTQHKGKHNSASTRKPQAPRWDAQGLMTPAKTPKAITPPSTGAIRRVNFQLADPSHAMPTPRKLKKHSRSAVEENVEIYSDWNARVPARDTSEDNPFNGPPTPATSLRHRSRKTAPQPLTPEMTEGEMQGRVENDEGLIFTFRGKKVFRPYEDTLADVKEAEAMGYTLLRRGRNQPRRLNFGVVVGAAEEDVDEEADTDIEVDAHLHDSTRPVSAEASAGSPFDDWTRTKSTRKRYPEDGNDIGTAKRAKNSL